MSLTREERPYCTSCNHLNFDGLLEEFEDGRFLKLAPIMLGMHQRSVLRS